MKRHSGSDASLDDRLHTCANWSLPPCPVHVFISLCHVDCREGWFFFIKLLLSGSFVTILKQQLQGRFSGFRISGAAVMHGAV